MILKREHMNDSNCHNNDQEGRSTHADKSRQSLLEMFPESLIPPHYRDLDEQDAMEPTPLREEAVNHFQSQDGPAVVSTQMHSFEGMLLQNAFHRGNVVDTSMVIRPLQNDGKPQAWHQGNANTSTSGGSLLTNMNQQTFLAPFMTNRSTEQQVMSPAAALIQTNNIGQGITQTNSQSDLSETSELWSTRASSLLGNLVCSEHDRKKSTRDKPKRPLSAYNIFFKEERLRLMSKDDSKQSQKITEDQKTVNGKIKFENLAKIVSSNWQKLEESDRTYYKEQAANDFRRYKAEMEVYERRLEAQNQSLTPKGAPSHGSQQPN